MRCKHTYAGIQISLHHVLLVSQTIRHIAIEQHKVQFLKVYIFTQVFHKLCAFVNIVQHKERHFARLCRESLKLVRFSTPHIGACRLSQCNPIIVAPFGNLLRKHPITIFRIRFQSLDTHAMHTIRQHLSSGQHIVIALPRPPIEMVCGVGSNLNPRHSRNIGYPNNCSTRAVHVANPRAMRNLNGLGTDSKQQHQAKQ